MYVQSDALLLAVVFENFRNMCLEIYELDPAKFLSALGLAWQAALKNTKIKSDLLTDIDMLLIVKRGIRGGISHSIYQYAKANKKYMKDYNKTKESPYIQYWDVMSYLVGQCCKKLLNRFERIVDTYQFNEDFIKTIMKKLIKDNVEIGVQYIEQLDELYNDLPFLPERMKIETAEKLVVT